MTDQEVLKTILMANIKKIDKESAIDSIIFLIGLHDISIKELNDRLLVQLEKQNDNRNSNRFQSNN